MPFVEFLARHHDRAAFDCGKEPLNHFLRNIARQNSDRNLGVTQVVVPASKSAQILGYFTLLTRTVEPVALPEKLPPRAHVGVVLLGRLAVDTRHQRRGLGGRMLLRAMAETSRAAERIGLYALVLDALDEAARAWYFGLGFGLKPVLDDPNRLYVSGAFIRQLQLGAITAEL